MRGTSLESRQLTRCKPVRTCRARSYRGIKSTTRAATGCNSRCPSGDIDAAVFLLSSKLASDWLVRIQRTDFTCFLNRNRIAVYFSRDPFEDFGAFFLDIDFYTRLAFTYSFGGAHNAGQHHQACGMFFKNGADGFLRHLSSSPSPCILSTAGDKERNQTECARHFDRHQCENYVCQCFGNLRR